MSESNIKKYIISEWNESKAVFAVDHNKADNELFHQMNNFWSGAKYRLDESNGDVVLAVLKMVAKYCFSYQAYHSLNNYGMMSHFGSGEDKSSGVEGYPRLDGSYGILLMRVDVPEFSIDEQVQVNMLDEMPEKPKSSF
jgi:hypothetical protein